jgi:hypothetical protein
MGVRRKDTRPSAIIPITKKRTADLPEYPPASALHRFVHTRTAGAWTPFSFVSPKASVTPWVRSK